MSNPFTISTLGELASRGRERHRAAAGASTRRSATTSFANLRAGESLFPGIVGYDDTVVPQLVNALLSQHNFILLGLRGQAKTRLLRALVTLLDERIPVMPGCEINDDPLDPICARVPRAHGRRGRPTRRSPGSAARRATSRSSPRQT